MKRILRFTPADYFYYNLFCSEEEIGDWDDNIKLSTKAVEFSALSDSVKITTGGSRWRVSDISVNSAWFYGFKNVNLEADSYIIQQDCSVIERRRDVNTLYIKVDANPLSVQRIITVGS